LNLRVPGPTPVPDPVLEAGSRQMINHRGPEFAQLIGELTAGVKTVFGTEKDLVILTCSGTGGLEAAVTNVLSPGERTLVVSIGVFGDRVAALAGAFGADVVRVAFTPGSAADPEVVREALKREPNVRTVFVTHNETSTGVTNDLESLSAVIKGEFGKTLVVDGISSISSIPCPVDQWDIDIAVSGSQKGWMCPPGLAMVSVSPRGWEAIGKATMPRFYFDLAEAKVSAEKGQTPWTPALGVMFGLREGLRLLLAEGMDRVYRRHAEIGKATRQGAKDLGLELFADEFCASNTVSAIKMPEDVSWSALSTELREQHEVVLAGGQGPLSGKLFRIGHLGWVSEADIQDALSSLEKALAKLRKVGAIPAGGA